MSEPSDPQSQGQGAGNVPAGEAATVKRRIPKSTLAQVQGQGETSAHAEQVKVQRVAAPDERREFFNDAMRETLGPLAGMLERKINPILAALEAIPEEAERLAGRATAGGILGPLDQPQNGDSSLPVMEPGPASMSLEDRILRPPGADGRGGGEAGFESICSRCRKCVEVCPAQAILLDPYGYIGGGFPYIIAHSQPCVVCSDLACMPACPTGALKVLDRLSIKMGTAKVNYALCLREHGENCTLCVEACPITREGAHPEKGDAIVIHAESGRVRVRKNVCIGCGLCESRCPTHPQAIQVVPWKAPVDPIVA